MNWPQAIIKELAARRCIVFLGAGASAGSLSAKTGAKPPTWKKLLEDLINSMNDHTDEIFIRDLIAKEKYLDAAELIRQKVSQANYTAFLRDSLETPDFRPSKIHEAVFKIDPKIVITTNYDEIYDKYCKQTPGYNVCNYYENHLVSDLKSPTRIIIKAHGGISDPSQAILTRSEYFKAKQKHPNFYKVLNSLFITHTILFLGFSLNDPDIQLVLENSNIASIGTHPHYACFENNIHIAIKSAIILAYNIEFIEFPPGNYAELENGLEDLADQVESHRASNLVS